VKLECKGYAGHNWSVVLFPHMNNDVLMRCYRCSAAIQGPPEPTSILNGKPIPENLVAGPDPTIAYFSGDGGMRMTRVYDPQRNL